MHWLYFEFPAFREVWINKMSPCAGIRNLSPKIFDMAKWSEADCPTSAWGQDKLLSLFVPTQAQIWGLHKTFFVCFNWSRTKYSPVSVLNPFRAAPTHPAIWICRAQQCIYKWADAEWGDLVKNWAVSFILWTYVKNTCLRKSL